MKSIFLEKLIERIDRVDPESLQSHFLHLARERGLLETIFQSIQEGVLVIDAAGAVSYVNRAAGDLLGFNAESATGRPVSRYLGDLLDWERLLEFEEDAWSKVIQREIEITYPEHRIVSFYMVPLSGDNSQDNGAVIIMRDVTRDKLQEASVLQSERMNAVQLLAAGVAHEIGNPLNALNIHLQLMDRDIKTLHTEVTDATEATGQALPDMAAELDNLHELVDVARTEVSRLDLIITQFLRAIRPSEPNLEPVDIEQLLEETLNLLKHEVANRAINIAIDSPSALPDMRLDRAQIKQAFFNVIKNAFQAMPDGGRLLVAVTGDREHVAISFQDTGVGIDHEKMGRIFDPYFTTKTTGSGLGLMIVQRIVQDHGGHIELMSKPEEGTRFTIYLPYVKRRMRLPAPAEPDDTVIESE